MHFLMRDLMLTRKKEIIKIDNFRAFPSFSGTLVRFLIKIDDFGFDFHNISLSTIAEVS